MSDDGNNETGFCGTNSGDANVASSYQTQDFELCNYDFPDDGYDYLKHFRTTGRGWGGYINANAVF